MKKRVTKFNTNMFSSICPYIMLLYIHSDNNKSWKLWKEGLDKTFFNTGNIDKSVWAKSLYNNELLFFQGNYN